MPNEKVTTDDILVVGQGQDKLYTGTGNDVIISDQKSCNENKLYLQFSDESNLETKTLYLENGRNRLFLDQNSKTKKTDTPKIIVVIGKNYEKIIHHHNRWGEKYRDYRSLESLRNGLNKYNTHGLEKFKINGQKFHIFVINTLERPYEEAKHQFARKIKSTQTYSHLGYWNKTIDMTNAVKPSMIDIRQGEISHINGEIANEMTPVTSDIANFNCSPHGDVICLNSKDNFVNGGLGSDLVYLSDREISYEYTKDYYRIKANVQTNGWGHDVYYDNDDRSTPGDNPNKIILDISKQAKIDFQIESRNLIISHTLFDNNGQARKQSSLTVLNFNPQKFHLFLVTSDKEQEQQKSIANKYRALLKQHSIEGNQPTNLDAHNASWAEKLLINRIKGFELRAKALIHKSNSIDKSNIEILAL